MTLAFGIGILLTGGEKAEKGKSLLTLRKPPSNCTSTSHKGRN